MDGQERGHKRYNGCAKSQAVGATDGANRVNGDCQPRQAFCRCVFFRMAFNFDVGNEPTALVIELEA